METMAPPLAALRLLTPRSAILLLSQCICHRPRFLLRTASDLALVMPLARTFDEQICLAVENNLRMDRHDGARAQIFLPHHLGGMGIVRNSGMASEKGQLISRLALTEETSTQLLVRHSIKARGGPETPHRHPHIHHSRHDFPQQQGHTCSKKANREHSHARNRPKSPRRQWTARNRCQSAELLCIQFLILRHR